jgi:uncharacterized protein (DUF1015 family)
MPQIHPFCGLRYNLAQIGSLSDVISPPYDVVNRELQKRLYDQSRHNFLRLELTQAEEGDREDDIYQRAAQTLRAWRSDNVLVADSSPSMYVYHQTFMLDQIPITRRGVLARMRLERFGEGKIYPHELTHAKAKTDRLKLTRATKCNLSPIFGLYPDSDNLVQEVLEQHIANMQSITATDHLGVEHKMWPVSNINLLGEVAALIENEPLFVADGHHRYETACNYRDELEAKGQLTADHPANFVLTMLVSMSDPGLVVLPTHRLIKHIEPMTSEELRAKLEPLFEIEMMGNQPSDAESVWRHIQRLEDQTTFAIYSAASSEWLLLRATEAAADRLTEIAPDQSEDWRELGVAMLHRLVFEDLLHIPTDQVPTYVHEVSEVVEALSAGTEFQLGALVMPATVDHIRQISLNQERMPAKSTYFYPKLVSGLVVNSVA